MKYAHDSHTVRTAVLQKRKKTMSINCTTILSISCTTATLQETLPDVRSHCHAVFPMLRLPALRPPASQCAPGLTLFAWTGLSGLMNFVVFFSRSQQKLKHFHTLCHGHFLPHMSNSLFANDPFFRLTASLHHCALHNVWSYSNVNITNQYWKSAAVVKSRHADRHLRLHKFSPPSESQIAAMPETDRQRE